MTNAADTAYCYEMSITSGARPGKAVAALRELGFSELESALYVTLAREGPQTAYSVARSIGQSPSNVYRLIESLTRKGALCADGGPSKIVRAVPIEDLIAQMRGAFERQTDVLQSEVRAVASEAPDPGTYRLERSEHVFARCRRMLAQAGEIVLVDAFPAALRAVESDLERALKRRVRTLVKAYAATDLKATKIILTPTSRFILRKWPGQWLNLVVDGREALIAYFDADLSSVHQAVWTGSLYVAWTYHSALAAELSLTAFHQALARAPRGLARDLLASVRAELFGKTRATADLVNGIFPP